ncbi:helix-turn-helix domain-containing protein [Streptomyces sp. 029-5]|uniref:helix-turn-helix domain-containing protein n=1 Tax=Streptomyces sp. 029-5 TaxID=2789261 RepID=UPI0039812EA6
MQDRNFDDLRLWKKGARLRGLERKKVAEQLKDWYLKEDLSIRAISARTGRSYGSVHRMLGEAGVEFRPRGGDNRWPQRAALEAEE